MTLHRFALRVFTIIASASSMAACAGGPGQSSQPGRMDVYHHGVFNWQGDYSWGVKVDYRDKSGAPAEGPYDIAVDGIGGFQPFAFHNDFDPTPYRYLVFSLKPTIAGQQWDSAFYAVGDIRTGVLLDVLKYGPPPVVGQWTTYKIPLGKGGYEIAPGTRVYKFMIQDQTADQTAAGYKTNRWYIDDIYFTAY